MKKQLQVPLLLHYGKNIRSKAEVNAKRKRLWSFIPIIAWLALLLPQAAIAQPVISGISPVTANNGATVTITGTGFNTTSGNNVVYFGATAGTVTAASSTSLSVTLNAEATYGGVMVTNLGNHYSAQSSQLFLPTYSGASGSLVNFAAKTDAVLSSYYPYVTVLADLDNDGKADMVCYDNAGGLWVNKNTGGSGTVSFASGSRFFSDYFNKASVAVADLDGDGLPDVITAYWVPDGNDIIVFKNTSSGSSISLGSAQYFGSSSEENFTMAIGDIDGDGRPDIVYGDPYRNRILILMNNSTVGSISFASTEATVSVSGFLAGLTLCDLDHDGKLDIAGCTSGTNVEVWRNTSTPGSVSFATGENISLTTTGTSETQAYGIAAADLDGDGKPDLAVTGYSSDFISILRNTSTGSGSISFATAVVLPAGATIGNGTIPTPTPSFGDFDGDGNTDIAVAAEISGKVVVFHNTGGGVAGTVSFSSVLLGTDSNPAEVAAGDLDGDGKADLAVSLTTSTHISVYRNLPLQPITGTAAVCVSSTTTLSDAATGGAWSSSNTSVASLSSSTSGAVTGVASGSATITYSLGTGYTTMQVTVNTTPTTSVSSGAAICEGSYAALTASGATTYSWAPSTGLSVTTGAAVSASPYSSVTYTVTGTNAGCSSNTATVTVTVTTAPTAISTASGPVISLVAGSGSGSYGGDGGAATAAGVYKPEGVVVDGSGNIYFADNVDGRIRKVSSGVITTFAGTGSTGFSGDNGPATAAVFSNDIKGLAIDATGNLYIADANNNRIRMVNTSGVINTVAGGGGSSADGVQATAESLSYPTGVAVDISGNIYIGEASGQKIRKVSTSGIITTLAGTGSYGYNGDGIAATSAQLFDPYGVSVDASGNVYIADYGNSRVRKVNTSGIISTIAGTGVDAFSGDGGPATAAKIQSPFGVYADGSGNIYIADYYSYRIRLVSASGNITTFAGNGTDSYSGIGGPATAAAIGGPAGVFEDAAGNVYISEYDENRIVKVSNAYQVCNGASVTLTDATGGGAWSSANTAIGTIGAGTGAFTGVSAGTTLITYSISGCSTTSTMVVNATPSVSATGGGSFCSGGTGLSLSASGAGTGGTYTWAPSAGLSSSSIAAPIASPTVTTIYTVTGTNASCAGTATVTVTPTTSPAPITIPGSGNIITTVAGNGTGGYTGDNVAATSTEIDLPSAVAVDGSGNIYIADQSNLRIRKVSSSGTISTVAGNGTLGYNGDGIAATSAQIINPGGVAVDGSGNIYFSDENRVRKVSTSGIISTIAGNGTAGFTGDGMAATNAEIELAFGIAVDGSGNLYIADYLNSRIRKVNTSGIISTIAGNGGLGYGSDGVAATATDLFFPTGVAVDGSGNVYIADFDNSRIRMVSTTGIISTFAGNGTRGYTGDGMAATNAQLNNAFGVAVDGSGNLYISDKGNSVIRKVNASGNISTVAGNGSGGYTGDGGVATSAELNNPQGVAIDGSGNIYIADASNNVIRKATFSSGTVCQGVSVTLTDATSGGAWSSSNMAVGTIGSGTGTFAGVAAGATLITYSISGCSTTATIFVNATPGIITGASSVCTGSNVTLSDASSGGVWSSGNTAVSTVSGGVVNGVAVGTAVISFTLGTGCAATDLVTVNPVPASISGASSVCTGSNTTLSDATSGGVWSSGNTGIATVGSGSGIVSGVASGSAIITYTTSAGCTATTTMNVGSISPITGASSICPGTNTTLSDTTSGGNWSSNNTSIATVGSGNGIVSGVSSGTAIITYTTSAGCTATTTMNVSSISPITGASNLCLGTNATLSDATFGGNWSSSNAGIATVGSGTGIVSGVALGSATITYSAYSGCTATIIVTVNGTPSLITGLSSVCQGSSISLSDATSGGVWSSSNTAVATIGSSGLLTGVSGGTVVISYAIGSSCAATAVKTVISLFSTTGITTVCSGSITVLNNPSPGGLWSSSNTGIATVNCNLGIVTGLTPGTSIITYTLGSGCTSTIPVTVISLAKNTGNTVVCVASTTTLSNTSTGGAWSSNDTLVARVNPATGVVTGISTGNAIITYSFGPGCATNTGVTILTLSPNTGAANVCTGSTTTLYNITTGGTWTSSSTSIATVVTGTGVVSGISAGTAIITYYFGNTCIASTPVTVNPLPSAITVSGGGTVCGSATISASGGGSGSTIYFEGTTSNGTSLSTPSSTEVVTVSGTYYFRAMSASGCWGPQGSVSVLIPAISGPSTVCTGSSITLGNTGGSGTWISSNPTVATIGSTSGLVTALTPGNILITNTLSSGCIVTTSITVGPAPAITGPGVVCNGQTITLTNAATGGTWTTSAPTVATVGSSGIVTGVGAGLHATITYTLVATTCRATYTVSVTALTPISVPGTGTVCLGQTINLSNATSGGTWSSSASGVASVITGTGIVTGVNIGSALISYNLPSGCITTTSVSTKILSPVSGPVSVCVGQAITLTDTTSGGTWSSASPTIATIGSLSGIVNGIAGSLSALMTYTLGTGCKATYEISVNALSAIEGPSSVCQGQTITLTNPTVGGTWSSGTTSIGTFGAGGVLSGVSAGIVPISYITSAGCIATTNVFVNPVASISGPNAVCLGQTMQLTDVAGAGTWSTSAPTIALVGSSTGIVTGVAAGHSATITYTFCTGCKTFTTVTINALSAISGASGVCQGQSVTLANGTPGGSWSASNGNISITTAGIITGITSGTVTISYILPTGCTAITTETVNPLLPVSGPGSALSVGYTTTLSDPVVGGTWSSSSPTIASIIAGTGVVTGVAGNLHATITYTLGTGCKTTFTVSTASLPAAPAAIGGPSTVSISGIPITLNDATTGGTWSSSNTSRATVVSSTGVVTGISTGTVTITYTVTNSAGCMAIVTKKVTVGPLPPPEIITVFDSVNLYVGANITLIEKSGSGVWSCNDCKDIASLNYENGMVTGLTAGHATVTYTINKDEGITLEITNVIVNSPHEESITSPLNPGNIKLVPNPNKGDFIVTGSLNSDKDEEVTLEILDMFGQEVYNGKAVTVNGKLNERIILSNNLANGPYLINLSTVSERYIFHFVVEK